MEATKESDPGSARNEKEEEKQRGQEAGNEDKVKHTLHELIRLRLSKKSGYKPDLSYFFVIRRDRQKAAQASRRDLHLFELSKD